MGLPAVPGLLLTLVLPALLVAVQPTGVSGQSVNKNANPCPQGKYAHPENNTICCTMCHKGTHLKRHCENSWMNTDCEPCPEGTFMEFHNYQKHCFKCYRCRKVLQQVELSACTVEQNTVCGCGPNQYRSGSDKHDFQCLDCSSCPNGSVNVQCQESQDTICTCHGGFYLKENKCEPCSECKNNSDCTKMCLTPSESVIIPEDRVTQEVLLPLVIFFGICLLLLLFLMLLCCSPRLKSKLASILCPQKLSTPIKEGQPDLGKFGSGLYLSSTFSPVPTFPSPAPFPNAENGLRFGLPVIETSPPLLKADPTSSTTSCLLPKWEHDSPKQCLNDPETLYAVVDHVPPMRWKEFVRLLGLSEHEIDRLELQNARCLREAQYSMLAAWRQGRPRHEASLELLGAVLCKMDLLGCLEDIQETLQGPAPPSPHPSR